MITKIYDLNLSDNIVQILETAMDILWIVFLPLLAKLIVQLAFGMYSVAKFGLRGLYLRCRTPATQDDDVSKPPRISVIVPAYNEEVGVVKTLQSIKNTKYPNLQLIVVNDGSTDKTHEKITRWIELQENNGDVEEGAFPGNQLTTTYLNLENGGKAAAMNSAIKHVDGEFVVTVDADSVMHHKALDEMIACFDAPDVGAVAGNVIVANRSKMIGMIQQMEYVGGFFFKRADSILNAVYIIGGAAAAYRKTVLDEVGSFDDAIITEDIELSTRILKHHWKTRYAHNAYIFTEGPSEWIGLANQRLRWKFGRLRTFMKHWELFFNVWHPNLYLTCFLLPAALYGEFLLFFDWIIFPLCIFYIFFVNMEIFFVVIMILTGVSLFQIAVDRKRKFHLNLLMLAPFAWIVALTIEVVEFTALHRSIWRLILGRGLKWQKWNRVGLSDGDLVDAQDDEDENVVEEKKEKEYEEPNVDDDLAPAVNDEGEGYELSA